LVDLNGRVIGINSRATFFANNIGFAIPVNIVKEVTKAIMTEGKVVRSWIGVHAQALQELEGYFGTDGTLGVLVASIDGGSPASQAGLQAGDIIQSMDGSPVSARFVEELPRFYRQIANQPPGAAIKMTVKRGSEMLDLSVTTKLLGDLMGEDYESQKWGFTVKGITRQMQIESQLKDTLGVFVIGVKRSGPADEGGLRSGDVIAVINRENVGSLAEFTKMYNSLSETKEEKILLNIKRGGSTRLVVVKPSDKNLMEQDSTATEAPIFHE
jgi:serine protease Do